MTLDAWLTEYGASHRHPVNKTIHRIAVPIIALDVLALVLLLGRALGLPALGWLAVLASLAFYARLSPRLAAGMALLALASLLGLDAGLDGLGAWALPVLALVFVVAWIAQFVGHALEGKKPSFFRDLQFLLIGPLWLLADGYERLGLDDERATIGPSRDAFDRSDAGR